MSAMAMDVDGSDIPKAPQACVACRKAKRKCSKDLPSCALCSRMSRACDYSETTQSPNADDFAVMRQKIADLEARLEGRRSDLGWHEPIKSISRSPSSSLESGFTNDTASTFPTAFFLDAQLFTESRMTVVKPSLPVPPEVLATLGTSILDIQDVVDRFFANIHTWLPFISKKRMQLTLSNPAMELSFDFALLLLSMKLITQVPSKGLQCVRSPLYFLAKRMCFLAESNALMSLQTLQANVLVAAYEIGHAIYPAAYLSAGHCARFGHVLGINDRRHAPQVLKRVGAWAEVEEQKRTWWAIMLLDRYVNLGTYGHPLATDDPARGDTLPVDDTLWDEGEMTTSEPIYVSSSTKVKAGPFARTAQACHLLGRLIRLLNDNMSDSPMRFTEAIQLHRTFQALTNLLPADLQRSPMQYGTSLALCYGGLLHLYDPFACSETNHGTNSVEETEMMTISIAGMKQAAIGILQFSQLLHVEMTNNPAAISPLIGDCIYMAAATYGWLVHETGSRESADAYHALRRVLETMNNRWALGGQYLAVLQRSKETLYPDTPLL
ncbi:hypothetical protein EDD36DRAFT_98280 [Exophiala viscosa]|uniref:Zn(2)-C6 fungal-type domain-containing protein n=1 Tax=Exophiala viscosa TaxID=2486360 RepID=A0AAN6DKR8_9EURO|nr:hypothetical protein EDD36DRAFT_98280 [Exophiala viscosa]